MDERIHTIEKDMTIFTAADLKPEIVRAVCEENIAIFNLSRVREIDTAGFQLLALAHREANQKDVMLQFRDCSDGVKEILQLYGKESWICN